MQMIFASYKTQYARYAVKSTLCTGTLQLAGLKINMSRTNHRGKYLIFYGCSVILSHEIISVFMIKICIGFHYDFTFDLFFKSMDKLANCDSILMFPTVLLMYSFLLLVNKSFHIN